MVEKFGMAGPHPLGSKVFGGFDDPGAEELLPETIDGDAGGEWVFLIDQPVGEVHAGGDFSRGLEWRKEGRGVAADFLANCCVVSTNADVGGVDVLTLAHDHGSTDLAEEVRALLLNFAGSFFGFLNFGADLFFGHLAELRIVCRDHGETKNGFDSRNTILGGFDLGIKSGKLGFLVVVREVNVGWLESSIKIRSTSSTGFGVAVEIIEEGIYLIEIFLGDGVVFVVVADGATHGEAHEGGADGGDAINDVLEMTFFGKGGPSIDDEVEPVEAGGDELVLCGLFVEVTGDLESGELVVGEVFVEGLDDPVAVGRVIAEVVVVVAVGVGDADEVEPILGHVFAVAGLGHEVVNELGVGLG